MPLGWKTNGNFRNVTNSPPEEVTTVRTEQFCKVVGV